MTALMSPKSQPRRPAAVLGLALIGLGAACAAPGSAGGKMPGVAGPLVCEIVVSGPRNAPSFAGEVRADRPVSGSYRMEIRSSGAGGSTLISQSGEFHAAPGAPARLGQATLSGDPARYHAELELYWNGHRLNCPVIRAGRKI
jgi:hypothetical protein